MCSRTVAAELPSTCAQFHGLAPRGSRQRQAALWGDRQGRRRRSSGRACYNLTFACGPGRVSAELPHSR